MGWKGLIRDTIMFIIGIALLLGWMQPVRAGVILIVTSIVFTVYAWLRFFKG